MSTTPTTDQIVAALNSRLRDYFPGMIEFELQEVTEGFARGRFPVTKRKLQPAGLLHGGATATLIDTLPSMGMVAHFALRGAKTDFVTTEMSIYYIKGVRDGDGVRGEARLIKMGRTRATWEVTLWRESDAEIVAKGMCGFQIIGA
ncbi:MAG: PaaI family thioesterase [Myxococcales bacterium]|nr:PaaI family thioesterase [Myxococcales bacterium]